jgi:hypothetical protein
MNLRVFLTVFIVISMAGFILADIEVFQPDGGTSQDSWIWQSAPGNNYGDDGYFYLGYYSGGREDVLIKFTRLDDFMGFNVTSATLELYTYGSSGTPNNNNIIYRINGNWNEDTVTWNNNPGYDTGLSAGFNVPTVPGWLSVDVTGIVRSWLTGGFSHHGFYLLNSESSFGILFFRSGEYANSSQRPKLTIDYDANAIETTSIGEIKSLFE